MRVKMFVLVAVVMLLLTVSIGETADSNTIKSIPVATKSQKWLDQALQKLCAAEEGRRIFNHEIGECESIPPEELLQELWQFYSKKGDGS